MPIAYDANRVLTYQLRRTHADGPLLEEFTGTWLQTIKRAKELANTHECIVNAWSLDAFGWSGSIQFFPGEL